MIEYYEPTGYRRIPLTTCEGGRELDKLVAHPCPNHQEEFQAKHRLRGFGLFLAIVLPIMVAGGVGWWVYTRWDGKFGQIKLGATDGSVANGSTGGGGAKMVWDAERPWIKYPVMVLAVSVAVLIAVPDTLRRGYRAVTGRFGGGRGGGRGARGGYYSGLGGDEDEEVGGGGGRGVDGGRRYTTRDSFARNTRGVYGDGNVDDEGELLGSDDDDEEEGSDGGGV